ncbi:hypothetical protein Btru_048720 [Bulinus truncatus]|nr:hypothetical protein Btru_048720 [Bulinus truncatus]
MSGSTRLLKADGLPHVVSRDRLITFFRNERSQGGGPVDDAIISEDGSSAVIIFKEPEAVRRVLGRGDTVTMSNVVVKVSPSYDYDKFKGYSSRPQADPTNKINSPTAQLANPQFTNALARIVDSQAKKNNSQAKQNGLTSSVLKNRHNSEPVTTSVCGKKEKKSKPKFSQVTDLLKKVHKLSTTSSKDATRTEDDPYDVTDVLKKVHKLSTTSSKDATRTDDDPYDELCFNTEDVFSNLEEPIDLLDADIKAEVAQVHRNYLLLIGDMGDPDAIGPLITGQTGVEVKEVIQQDKPDCCIVVFSTTLNIAPSQWELTALGTIKLIAGPVYKTSSILVSGLTEAVSIATLVNYLENKSAKRKVIFLETISNDQQVIVYFEHDEGLTNDFLKQDHIIDNVRLYFSQYYPCLSKDYVYAKEFTEISKPSVGVREKSFSHHKTMSLEQTAFNGLLQRQYFDQIRSRDKEVQLSFDLRLFKVTLKGNDESKLAKVHKDILHKCNNLYSTKL